MKTKISRIMGVGLALLMVFSLAFALVPAKTEAAPSLWTPEVLPNTAGTNVIAATDVDGMAVASDGYTIYVIDNQTAGSQVWKSPNGGRTFAAATNPPGFTAPFLAVAVAPDNPNVVAVVDSTVAAGGADGVVYVSRDGGVNWVTLPRVTVLLLST